jgi:competence protein ComGC
MKIQNAITSKTESHRCQADAGFTTIQMLITIALITVVSAFALFAIDTARASVRLTGSTRELAGYLEKARSNAIRRNSTSVVTIIDQNNYTVTMDFDGDGTVETRTISLQSGVTFPAGQIGITAIFDWRGRVPNEIRLELDSEGLPSASINLSGSGDVTIGSEIFEDGDIAAVTLNSDPSTVVSTSPGGDPSETESPTESTPPEEEDDPPADDDPETPPSEDPPPDPDTDPDTDPDDDPTTSPPSPDSSPSPSPITPACVLSAPSTLSLPRNGSPKTFSVVTITNANSTVITATKSGDIISVSPATTTVSGNGTISYTIRYPGGNDKSGTVTVSSSCGTKTISISFDQ